MKTRYLEKNTLYTFYYYYYTGSDPNKALDEFITERNHCIEFNKKHPNTQIRIPNLNTSRWISFDIFYLWVGPMICIAAQRGWTGIVRTLILEGANLNLKDNGDGTSIIKWKIMPNDGYTALMYAALKGNVEIMEMLLDAKVDLNIKTGYLSRVTALDIAAEQGYPKCVNLLLEAKAHVSSRTMEYAAKGGSIECIKLLLNSKVSVTTTAIQNAINRNYLECVTLLADSKIIQDKLKRNSRKFHLFQSKPALCSDNAIENYPMSEIKYS